MRAWSRIARLGAVAALGLAGSGSVPEARAQAASLGESRSTPAGDAAAPEAAPPLVVEAETEATGSVDRPAGFAAWQRDAAFASMIAGGAAAIVGATFGFRSLSERAASDVHCRGDVCYDQAGVDRMESARAAGNISTVAFVLGGVAFGAAAVFWFVPLGRENEPGPPEVGFGPGVVSVRGAW